MIVAKNFKWEAAHRLPWHEGKCRHLHGHSYRMLVEFEGECDVRGFVIDFNEIKKIIDPYIQLIDHTTIISKSDLELKAVYDNKKWKYFLIPYDSTAENLCNYFSKIIIEENGEVLRKNKIQTIGIKIFETDTSYAYSKVVLK